MNYTVLSTKLGRAKNSDLLSAFMRHRMKVDRV